MTADLEAVTQTLAECSVEECNGPIMARRVCGKHYKRLHKYGTTDGPQRLTQAERFWAKVEATTTCWLWVGAGAMSGSGSGSFWDGERYCPAHHITYIEANGPIPDGLQIDHLCRVRNCVNPSHLEAVTATENKLRGTSPPALNLVKTHCKRGHVFDEANTKRKSKGRSCRACDRDWKRRYRAALSGGDAS